MDYYLQTTSYTGAPSCLLTALHSINKDVELSLENEFSFWLSSANLPTRSCSVFAMACIAFEHDVQVEIVVESEEFDYPDYRFKRYKKTDIEQAAYSSSLYVKRAKEKNIPFRTQTLTLPEIKAILLLGKYVLTRINAGVIREGKATSKYVLLTGYTNNAYQVFDPLQGMQVIAPDVLQVSFDTLKTTKRRDQKMLILG